MADLRDYTKNNQVFAGTDGIRLPTGNNAQRTVSSNVAGTLRFNTDIDGIETYTSVGWRPLASPPSISTVSPSAFNGESGTQFTIIGAGFAPDAQVYFITSNSTQLLATTITYYSSTELRATTPRAIKVEEEPLSVRVVQQSGSIIKSNCIDAGGVPNWITTAGTLGSIFGANTVNVYVSATDPEGTAISYQLSSGSLPGGLSLSSANGLIQGVASSVLANTTYNFIIKANDTVNNNTDRSFSYTVLNRAPLINTAAGSLGTIYSGNAVPTATISAYDPDGGSLTYSIDSGSLPANTGLGSANGVIQGTPVVATSNTTYTFSIRTTDQGSLFASNTYTYTVLNRPPLWNTDATLTSANADSYSPITINAYDPDGGSITYSLTSGSVPSGLTFVSANATIVGTAPEVVSNTTSTFTVTATDVGNDANARTFSLTITPIIDAQFSNTMLLIHGSSNTAIKDASSNNYPLTVVGDTHALNFSPFNTSWSYNGNGTDSYMYIPYNSNLLLNGVDSTIECWVYFNQPTSTWNSGGSPGVQTIIGQGTGAVGGVWSDNFFITADSTSLNFYGGGSSGVSVAAANVPIKRWFHLAVVVTAGTSAVIYFDGVSQTSGSISAVGSSTGYQTNLFGNFLTGGGGGNNSYLDGYVKDLRIVKGSRVYTGNFTPPTTSLTAISGTVLLIAQDNRFKDNSTNNFTLTRSGSPKIASWGPFEETDTTTGSMYFDGTGDYLNLGTPYNFGTNNFTVEGWFYINSALSVTSSLWGSSNGGGAQPKFQVYLSSGTLTLDFNGSGVVTATASTYLQAYAWNHIAYCRGGTSTNQTAVFINGVRAGVGTVGSQTGITTNFTIGYNESGAIASSYISNFRIVDGTDVYGYTNTTYTVPTSPLTSITNTRLLTFQNRQPHNNHGIIDNSRNKLMITRNGNVSQGTFTPFSADPGKWSVFFNGSSGVRFADNAAFQFGTSAFTVEGWFNVSTMPSNDASIISKWVAANDGNSSWMVDFQSSNLSAAISIGGSVTRISGTVGVPLGVWNHFALVRSGSPGTLSLFMNGARIATGTPTGSLVDDSNPVGLGVRGGTDGYYLTGSLTNIRVVNGTALYDPTLTTYTVPTSTLGVVTNTKLLTCQNNQFIDNSTANSSAGFTATALSTPFVRPFSPFAPNTVYTTANTGGGVYFDGTGDYLLTPSVSNLAFRTGPFTMEAWHYGTTTSSGGQLVSSRTGSINDAASISFYITGGNYSFYGNGNHVSAAYVTGQWNHVVYTRDAASTLRLFINGKLAAYETSYTPDITNKQIGIGSLQSGGEIIPACWASDIRLIAGSIPTSYQTSSTTTGTQIFTPPTAPLTITSQGALANAVTLLLNFTDAAIIDSSAKNIFETSGDAKSNNTISKFNGGSVYLDGNADYLILPATAASPLGTVNFTWECWIYRNAVTDASYADGLCCSSAGITGFGAGIDPSGYIGYAISASSGSWDIRLGVDPGQPKGSIAVPLRTWTHIALVRNGSTFTGYVNGQVDQTFTSSSAISNLGNSYYIGRWHDANTRYFNGHIQEFRITRSARYTTTFTPPARSFPNK